MFIIKN